MRARYLLLVVLLLAAGLVACSDEEATPEPTDTPEPTATALPPTETPEPTDTPEPTATATAEVEATETPAAEAGAIEMTRVENETMGISVLVPDGWSEAAAGVYARGQSASDLTRLIQQAAPGATTDAISGALLGQLGIEALPDPVDTLETDSLTWDLYELEVEVPPQGTVAVDLALAENESAAFVVVLQASVDEVEALREAVFRSAVEGFEPSLEGDDGSASEGNLYEDPEGLFSVPLPTNWTVEESEQYVTLLGPEEGLTVHILALDGEEAKGAVEEAWQIVDPDFDKEETETVDVPTSAAGGVDEFILVNYEREDEEPIVQVEGRRYEGKVYVLIFILDVEAYQRRAAQVQTIDTGFDITALEEVDLSGVEPAALSEELIAELEAYTEEQMEELDTPGAAVAIVRDGEVVYANGFGVRDRETGEPVTAETLMMIGSTTKPMTTMLMAGLVDEGVFEWDTPVVEILPSFEVSDPELSQQITMRNLVCACTGVPRRDFEWLFNANEMDAEEVITSLADFEFFTDFGETFQYSNQMVATGGYVATLAAGGEMATLRQDYVDLMQERIFDPMGMAHMTFSFDEVAASDDYAMPYGQTPLGEIVRLPMSAEAVLIPLGPAGAAWSNVQDMAKFALTNLAEGVAPGGERVVSAENLGVTWEPQVEISADASYGLGWIVEEYKGLRILSHGGNTFGFTSELAFVPEADLGVVVLTNQQASSINQIVRVRLLELLYEQESEADELVRFAVRNAQEEREELQSSLVEIDADVVAPYLAEYENDVLGTVTIAWENEMLVMDAGEFQTEIRARESEDEVRYFTFTPPIAGVPLELTENDAREPIVVFGTGVVEYTFTQAP